MHFTTDLKISVALINYLDGWLLCPRFSSLKGLKVSTTVRPGKKYSCAFWTYCIRNLKKKKSFYVSLCYSFNLSQLKYFHFKPTYKQDIFGLLLTLHATLLKIKVSYHKASHSVCHSSCQRLVSIVSVYIICTGISGPYYPQIDD